MVEPDRQKVIEWYRRQKEQGLSDEEIKLKILVKKRMYDQKLNRFIESIAKEAVKGGGAY